MRMKLLLVPQSLLAPLSFALQIGKVQANTSADPAPMSGGIVFFKGVQIIGLAAPFEEFGQAQFRVVTVAGDGRPLATYLAGMETRLCRLRAPQPATIFY